MTLRTRLQTLSTRSRVVCVVIGVASLAAGTAAGLAMDDALWSRWIIASDPITSPDGTWQAQSFHDADDAGVLGGYGRSRIDVWPVRQPDSRRMVYRGDAVVVEWMGRRSLTLSDSHGRPIATLDVATDEHPGSGLPLAFERHVVAALTGATVFGVGLFGVGLLVALRTRKADSRPEEGDEGEEATSR